MSAPSSNLACAPGEHEPIWLASPFEHGLPHVSCSDRTLARLRAALDDHHAAMSLFDIETRNGVQEHRAGRLEALRVAASIQSSNDAVDLELVVGKSLRSFEFGDAEGIHLGGASIWAPLYGCG